VLRILPPLNVSADELAYFAEALSGVVNSERKKSESGKT
jgi:acetylornithine/succinyldiaminopimelate/putrescine aminotransferase